MRSCTANGGSYGDIESVTRLADISSQNGVQIEGEGDDVNG